jgi:MerR family transcriptional regulator, mercuric resistance operon regulatory protein
MSDTFKIGYVAKKTGLSIDAIRFYEKQGLLQSPSRSEGGFRLFQDKDIANLRLIRSSQSLGFSLDEIRDLLSICNGISSPCAEVMRLLEQKLVAIREKIAELNSLEDEVATALRECKQALRRANSEDQTSCPVLDANRPRVRRKK